MNDRTLPRDFLDQLRNRPSARPADMTDPDVLAELIADPQTPEAVRRNFQSKLDAINHKQDRQARLSAMTAEEIVALIPRDGFR